MTRNRRPHPQKVCDRCGKKFGGDVATSDDCSCKRSEPSTRLVEGEDYYLENGLMVFSQEYHLKRGFCCGSGCRHCPY